MVRAERIERAKQENDQLLRCIRGDIVRKRILADMPDNHCEVLHVKGDVLTIRNLKTKQRETAPVSFLLLVRRVPFNVDVFSVEDACNKHIADCNRDMFLGLLVQKIRDEFLLPALAEVSLIW